MCGIIAVLSTKNVYNAKLKAAMEDLIRVGSLRGEDSTGMIAVNKDGDAFWYKSLLPGWEFSEIKRIDKTLFNHQNYNALVFHNRKATIGNITKDNAHPFDFEKIIGVHNGTLRSWYNLHKDNWKVDSQAMFASINDDGPVEALKKTEGAVSTIFYDKADKQIYIYHNDERPLSYAKIKDEDTWVVASELGMLVWVLTRNGLKIEKYDEVPVNKLIRMSITDFSNREDTEVRTYAPPPKSNYHSNVCYANRHWPATNAPALLSGPQNPRIGEKILCEINTLEKANSKHYNGPGIMLEYNYSGVVVQHITPDKAGMIQEYLDRKDSKESGTFLLYCTVMSLVKTATEKYYLVTPYKQIEKYATQENQDRILAQYVEGLGPSGSSDGDTDDVDVDEDKDWCLGPGGEMLSLKEFNQKVEGGCGLCGSPLFPKDEIDWDTYVEPCHTSCVDIEESGYIVEQNQVVH